MNNEITDAKDRGGGAESKGAVGAVSGRPVEEAVMNKRILIVERREKILWTSSASTWAGRGYETIEAYDGQTGLQLALEQDPDLVLLGPDAPQDERL